MTHRQRGYTLLEVIVAFALLAMALTLLLGILSGSARQVRQSADAGRAAPAAIPKAIDRSADPLIS